VTDPKKTSTAEATITSGGLIFKNQKQTLESLVGYFGEDAHLTVEMWLWEKRRSTASNRFYFGVIVRRIAEQQGVAVLDVHKALKFRLLQKPLMFIDVKTGEVIDEIVVGDDTHNMTQKEFNTFVRSAELFSTEFFGIDFTSEERNDFYSTLGPETDAATAQAIEAHQKNTNQADGTEEKPPGVDPGD